MVIKLQIISQEIPDKQFTSDNEYSGTASSVHSKQMLYDNMYNARVNHVREGTLVGRKPTDSNVSKLINSDDINMSIKKLDHDRVNRRAKLLFQNYSIKMQVNVVLHKKKIL